MRTAHRCALLAVVMLGVCATGTTARPSPARGIVLGDLTWVEAEAALTPSAVVVIPLGAGAKEHGPHLRLDNDLRMAQYFADRVLAAADVVVAPAIPYHFYPAFLEYPGSTHLAFATARDLVVDIVHSLARCGPRRFYVLNTGVSTMRPLGASTEALAKDGILLRYTDILTVAADATRRVEKQQRGTHADEIETSMMLYIAPNRVNMALAVRDDGPDVKGPLTRTPGGQGIYSKSGIWGDPTLATREKGEVVVEATVQGILKDIDELRVAALPPRE